MHFTDPQILRDQAANVLSDLYALYELERYHIFDDPRDAFYEVESHIAERVSLRILQVAAMARVNDDVGGGFSLHADRHPDGVGLLKQGRRQERVLTAREACNKIMHATNAKLALGRITGHPIYQHLLDRDFPGARRRDYARPMLSLIGTRTENRSAWQVTCSPISSPEEGAQFARSAANWRRR